MTTMAYLRSVLLPLALQELDCPNENDYLETGNMLLFAEAERSLYPRLGTSRILDYVEETVPRYSDPLFRCHFRMTRSSFQGLLEMIAPLTEIRTVSLEKRTLACLWYVSNGKTYRSVVDRFDLSKGSLRYFLMNFSRTLTSNEILSSLLTWPQEMEQRDIMDKFAHRAGFPGVIGAIDGTYIPIPGPSAFRDSYICRKGFPAMHLQGVCDSNLRFLDVYCAYPGSVHDSRVFRNSPLNDKLECDPIPHDWHLLGDSAYALSTSMMVPFRDNGHLTEEQKGFNNAHSATRVDIERCFGLLKGKFRKLKYLDMRVVKDIPQVVVSCCVLHNFILEKESICEADIEIDDMSHVESFLHVSENRNGSDKRAGIAAMLV